jgi:hypothetical protein
MQHIIVYQEAGQYVAIGPFPSFDKAIAWASAMSDLYPNWTVTEIHAPLEIGTADFETMRAQLVDEMPERVKIEMELEEYGGGYLRRRNRV